MSWFDDLKACLGPHYTSAFAPDIVGYLQGSPSPTVWQAMDQAGSGQMIVLDNRPPSAAEWQAAGVAQRNQVQEIRLAALAGFIVVYGGFMFRPWGHVVVADPQINFPAQLDSWRRNFMPPRQP